MIDLDKMLATRAAIMDDIAADILPEALAPDEFTVNQVFLHIKSKGTNINRRTVEKLLQKRIEAGELDWHWVRLDGSKQRAYRAKAAI